MKKLNLKKLNIKELLLQHVEKIVAIIAAICLLGFVISAIGKEKLPASMEPTVLTDTSTKATQHVERGTFQRPDFAPDMLAYVPRARRDPVKLETYHAPIAFNAPVIDAKTKRDRPPLLSVTSLRVNVGFAPFALAAPESAEDAMAARRRPPRPGDPEQPTTIEKAPRVVERAGGGAGVRVQRGAKLAVKYWAMVTALVPLREQHEAYKREFEQAVNFNADEDLPAYKAFQIERAEVVSGDLKNLNWKVIAVPAEFMAEWAGDVQEPVMAEYVTETFVMPLGPRVGSDWEEYVGHPPEIPLEPKRGRAGMPGRMGPGGLGDAPFGGAPRRVAGGPEDAGDEQWRQGARARRPGAMQEVEDPEIVRKRNESVAIIGQKPIKGIDHTLFRFCDYTVEPGKQYVYRVRLSLRNPNFGIPVQYLKKPDLGAAKAVATDWSEVSPVATIPFGDKMLAGPTEPGNPIKEPKGHLRIVQINKEVGIELPLDTTVERGLTANFTDREVEYVDPISHEVKMTTASFLTDAVVLDIRGGRPISKDKQLKEPGELLVLSRTGQLVAMNEFEDRDTWSGFAVPEERPQVTQDPLPDRAPRNRRPGAREMRPAAPGGDPLKDAPGGPPRAGRTRPPR